MPSTGTQSAGGVLPRISKRNREGIVTIRFPYLARSEAKVGDSMGDDARLPGAGSSENEKRILERGGASRCAAFRVESNIPKKLSLLS